MTNKMENKDKLKLGLMLLLVVGMVVMIQPTIKQLKMITGEEYSECGYSPYNIYSNSTEAYESFFGTKCYIPVSNYYETKRECGFLGISCYESSESHVEIYKSEVCFYKQTGELC